ncbi:MAG: alpha/beta fold hydrolase, partial [Candidatus Saccharimonadales bacterium]
MQPTEDGYVTWGKYRTYYKVVGKQVDKNKLPLLVLNGGPGSSHDYLLDLRLLAENGRQVIFYDSVGCGRSDRPDDDSLWTIGFFIQEIDAIRKELKLKAVHILGHSWGGMLAIEYLLTKPSG